MEMKLYLFVRVASTANLWCDKQKLIKKIVEQSRKKRKINFSFRHDNFSKLSKRYSLLKKLHIYFNLIDILERMRTSSHEGQRDGVGMAQKCRYAPREERREEKSGSH